MASRIAGVSRGLLKQNIELPSLGLRSKSKATATETTSGMKNRRRIFIRSQWHLTGSASRAAAEASSSSENKVGKGPAMRSPSNMVVSRGQDFRHMVGMLSLKSTKINVMPTRIIDQYQHGKIEVVRKSMEWLVPTRYRM